MKIEIDTDKLGPVDIQVLALIIDRAPDVAVARDTDWKLPEPTEDPTATRPESVNTPPDFGAAQDAKTETPEEPAEAPSPGVTMAEAVAAATQLVSAGEAAKVKAALAAVGSKRVSEIPEDKLAEFVAALQ